MLHFYNILPSKLDTDLHRKCGIVAQQNCNFVGPSDVVFDIE